MGIISDYYVRSYRNVCRGTHSSIVRSGQKSPRRSPFCPLWQVVNKHTIYSTPCTIDLGVARKSMFVAILYSSALCVVNNVTSMT